jgi:hypothetical protein
MGQIVAFLQKRVGFERPEPSEFTTQQFMSAAELPHTTAENLLKRAFEQKLVSSRKISHFRYWKIVDLQAWQEWLDKNK